MTVSGGGNWFSGRSSPGFDVSGHRPPGRHQLGRSRLTNVESARALGNLAGNAIFCRLLLDYGVVQLLVSCYVGANIESRRMAAMALCNFSSKIESHPLLLEMNVLSLATSECRAALDLKQTSDHETLRFCILIIANLTGGNHSHSLAETLFGKNSEFLAQLACYHYFLSHYDALSFQIC